MRKFVLAASVAAAAVLGGVTLTSEPASAWVAYRGGGWGGGWHGGVVYHGGGWGYPGWRGGCCWGGVAAGAAVGAAAGLAVGAAIGSTYAALPPACPPYGTGYYYCGGAYYRPYYGPNGVVYQVVPAP